jgi:hypothetical protein
LFRPDNLYLEHVGKDSFYGFLAEHGPRLFQDEDFAALYHKKRGRPGVPPSQLCVILLLQTHDKVSDSEAVARSAYDLRWKVALGIDLEDKLCAKSTLQLFRAKLVLHEAYGKVFEKSILACREAGLLKSAKIDVAIDTTPILGRGAVKDTYNLVSDQIRRVIREAAVLGNWKVDAVVNEHGLAAHFGSSFKGSVELDWNSKAERNALVTRLIADAKVARQIGEKALEGQQKSEKAESLRSAIKLLDELLLQDIEDDPDGDGSRVIRGTKKDRIPSTTDPEIRHGRKTESKTFDGYRGSVVVDTNDGVILSTDIRAANVSDREQTLERIEEAEKNSKTEVSAVFGDTAYGSYKTRKDLEGAGYEVVAKAPPPGRKPGCFSIDDFEIDSANQQLTCPAGKTSREPRRHSSESVGAWRYEFSPDDCQACPLRERCTTSKKGYRSVVLSEGTEEMKRIREGQRSQEFRERYRQRVIVEHRIARLVQLGIRQARYLGVKKSSFQIMMAAAVANLGRACSAGLSALLALVLTLERMCTRFTDRAIDRLNCRDLRSRVPIPRFGPRPILMMKAA